MAISIIFGPGGSGKSFYQVSRVIQELRESRRNILTNLALNLARLNEYCQEKYPDESIDVVGRVRLLTLAETREFWKYRGPVKWKTKGETFDYETYEDPGEFGVAYFIDEAGAAGFSAQGWAATEGKSTRGVACSWYLDQQRKFADNVYASTNGRTPAQIAKAFRDKAHVFIKLKNGYLQQYGIFRGRGRFEASHFLGEQNFKPELSFKLETFPLDVAGLGSCYRTEDGVGVQGRNADKGARAKGIPIILVLPAAAVAGLACILIPWILGKGASKIATGKTAAAAIQQSAKISKGPVSEVRPAELEHVVSKPLVSGTAMRGTKLFVAIDGLGWFEVVGRVSDREVQLSNGLRVAAEDVARGRSAEMRAVPEKPRSPAL